MELKNKLKALDDKEPGIENRIREKYTLALKMLKTVLRKNAEETDKQASIIENYNSKKIN